MTGRSAHPVADIFNLRYTFSNAPARHGCKLFRSLETFSASALGWLPVASFEMDMTKQTALPAQLPPRLIGREAAAAYVCVSPTTFDQLVIDGRMPKPRQLTQHRKAWDVRELDVAVDNLPKEGESASNADFGWDEPMMGGTTRNAS